eukprot:817871-Pyramimonas_sp.AAC.4
MFSTQAELKKQQLEQRPPVIGVQAPSSGATRLQERVELPNRRRAQTGEPPAQEVSRETKSNSIEDPMAGRMSEVKVPGWYGVEGCAPCFCGHIARCGDERIFLVWPACCWFCIPCLCCPMLYTNKLPNWDLGDDSGTLRQIRSSETMVWTSPTSYKHYGPFDPKDGTSMVKLC